MSHMEYKEWMAYVANEIDEKTRLAYEQHLFSCDECLELYVKAVQSYANEFPQLTDDFTDKVAANVPKQVNAKQQAKKSTATFQKSFLHYVIAAAMTLALMSSGIFSQLTQVVSQFEQKAGGEQKQSLTEELIDKTLSFIQITEQNKEVK